MIFDIYGTSNFEKDLLNNSEIMNRVMDESFAKKLYASLCNVIWIKDEEKFASSWRYSGGLVAFLRNCSGNVNEDYLNFYMSGCEGKIFTEVREVLEKLGWSPSFYDE